MRSPHPTPPHPAPGAPLARLRAYIKLGRLKQWTKGAFVLVGPVYGLSKLGPAEVVAVLGAFLAFGFASSGCYVFNDIRDREADRAHPRKRRRPLAAGTISVASAVWFGLVMWGLAGLSLILVPGGPEAYWGRELLALAVGVYIVNVVSYSLWFKNLPVLDVISLAGGFVLRVLGGCAAAALIPTAWLLNCTFFVSMFLAFGKRLGERRTMGAEAANARGVQAAYSDDLLRMSVVVTAVACLVSYSDYVQAQAERFTLGFNLLWLTMLPATYGLLRCMLMVERGVYDDPTELATKDRPFQMAVAIFGLLTVALLLTKPGAAPALTG